jgi:hypothetical protein
MGKRSRSLPTNLQPVTMDAQDLVLKLLADGPLTIGHIKTLLGQVGINATLRLTKRVNPPVTYRAGRYWSTECPGIFFQSPGRRA